jgi:hypothetical protein
MITCYLRYEVDPDKLADFEAYGAMWLELMPRFGASITATFCHLKERVTSPWRCLAFRVSQPTSSIARTLAPIQMFRRR